MILTDEEIERLLRVEKRITNPRAREKEQKGSRQINYEAESEDEKFQVFFRQNKRLVEDFSCGLIYVASSGTKIMLTRYNGSSHPHSNPLESGKKLMQACHIHRATRRYMEIGRKSEHYAETTDRYTNVDGAFLALLTDCNVKGLEPPDKSSNQHDVFDRTDD